MRISHELDRSLTDGHAGFLLIIEGPSVLNKADALNHYRDGDRSFPGARQWFDLISTALIRLGIFNARRGRGRDTGECS